MVMHKYILMKSKIVKLDLHSQLFSYDIYKIRKNNDIRQILRIE